MLRLAFFFVATAVCAQIPSSWSGTWRGPLANLPLNAKSRAVETTLEIGAMPKEGECTTWRSTFTTPGKDPVVKAFKLCREEGYEHYRFELDDGYKLKARFVGGVLSVPHKYRSVVLIQMIRLRGDTLEQEILTAADRPEAEAGPQSLETMGLQRITFQRVP